MCVSRRGTMGPRRCVASWFFCLCFVTILSFATGQDPADACSETDPSVCADRCTLDGRRESICPYECVPGTGACFNDCDLFFSDGQVAYSTENAVLFDTYVPHCAARLASASAKAFVDDSFTSELRYPPNVTQGLSPVPFSMFRNGLSHAGRSASSGPVSNVTVSWTFQTGGRIFSSPTLAENGTVYVGCMDGLVYGVSVAGVVKWRYPAGGPVVATAAIGNNIGSDSTLFIGSTDGTLHAVSANYGTSKCSYVRPRSHLNGTWQLRAKKPIVSSAAIAVDGVVFVGADNSLFAIHAATGGGGFAGTTKWSFETRGLVLGSPALDTNDSVFVGSMAGTLYSLRRSDGKLQWEFHAAGGLYSSPSLDLNRVDGTADRVYIGGVDSYLYALNATNGKLLWKFRAAAAIYASPATAPPADQHDPSGGLVFVGSTDWKLYAVRANDGVLAWNQTLRKQSTGGGAAANANGTGYENTASSTTSDTTNTNVTDTSTNTSSRNSSNTTNVTFSGHDGYGEPARTPYTSAGAREKLDAARVLKAEGVCPPNLAQGVGEELSLRFGSNMVLTCGRDTPSVGVVGSPVYAWNGTHGFVYVGSSDSAFYAIAAETGKVQWQIDVAGPVASSAAIDSQGRLYFATDNGVVYQVVENSTTYT